MAPRCNPSQKVDKVQESFVGYISNKSFKREHVVTCSRLPRNNFSFLYKLLQFFMPLFPLDVTPTFLQDPVVERVISLIRD